MERPRNWLCLTSSYRLTLRSSNTRHRWAAVHEEVAHAHDVVLVVGVPPGVQELQDPHLHAGLHWHSCPSV